jgi:PKD repeat protein
VTVALNGALAAYAGVHVTAGQTTTLDVTLPVPCAAVAGADLRMTPSEPWIGETARVTGSITSASLPVTYTWDFGEGDPVRTGNPVPHTYETLPISQTYTLVMTATNRCSSARVTRDVAIRIDRWYLPLLFKASL